MLGEIGKRIAELRKEREMTQDDLADKSHISRISIARYETGVIEPGVLSISRIADALGVSTDELLCRTNKLPPFLSMIRNTIPVIGDIACGTPITAQENVDGYVDLPEGVAADFALKCKGESMTPTFLDGDIVLIRQQPEVEDGQIAAVSVDNEATLKRFYKREDGVLLVADNPAFAPIYVKAGAGDLVVYGKVVGFVRMI
jgi:repressor LexA